MMQTFTIAIALCVLAGRAHGDSRSDAERLYREGQTAFDANKLGEALHAWQKSYDLSRAPGLLFNIAQAYRLRAGTGDCALAAATYRKFIAEDPSSPQRATAERFAEETEKCAASQSRVVPIGPEPKPEPKPASPSPSPPIVLPAIPPASTPRAKDEPVSEFDRARTKRLVGLGVAAGGGLAVGLGLYFGSRASSIGNEVTTGCATSCDWSIFGPKEADGRSAERKQYIFAGVGVLAILGGGALYWLGVRESRTSVAIQQTDGGIEVAWGRTW